MESDILLGNSEEYKLECAAKEIRSISHYEIDGKEIERVGI